MEVCGSMHDDGALDGHLRGGCIFIFSRSFLESLYNVTSANDEFGVFLERLLCCQFSILVKEKETRSNFLKRQSLPQALNP